MAWSDVLGAVKTIITKIEERECDENGNTGLQNRQNGSHVKCSDRDGVLSREEGKESVLAVACCDYCRCGGRTSIDIGATRKCAEFPRTSEFDSACSASALST